MPRARARACERRLTLSPSVRLPPCLSVPRAPCVPQPAGLPRRSAPQATDQQWRENPLHLCPEGELGGGGEEASGVAQSRPSVRARPRACARLPACLPACLRAAPRGWAGQTASNEGLLCACRRPACCAGSAAAGRPVRRLPPCAWQRVPPPALPATPPVLRPLGLPGRRMCELERLARRPARLGGDQRFANRPCLLTPSTFSPVARGPAEAVSFAGTSARALGTGIVAFVAGERCGARWWECVGAGGASVVRFRRARVRGGRLGGSRARVYRRRVGV